MKRATNFSPIIWLRTGDRRVNRNIFSGTAMEVEKQRSPEPRKKMETKLLQKVGEVISAVKEAKLVDEIIYALHSLAVMLFPVDASLFSGTLEKRYRNQVIEERVPGKAEMDDWCNVFYHGAAFPTLARLLLYDVASNWLACFPLSARTYIYDIFFVNGSSIETIQSLVPALLQNGPDEDFDRTAVFSNAERLIVLCLLKNKGIQNIIQEFSDPFRLDHNVAEKLKPDLFAFISSLTQLIASIPDKARPKAPAALSSHLFFKQIAIQLLAGAQERGLKLYCKDQEIGNATRDAGFLFVGEMFSRICRRGATDTLVMEMLYQILQHVRRFLSSDCDSVSSVTITLSPEYHFWPRIMEAMTDPYAVERLSEEFLRRLAAENITDAEAYWSIWMLFHSISHKKSLRAMFVDKFILWKVFPICCLRWILQFSVLECPPQCALKDDRNPPHLLDTVQRLVRIWSKRGFVQSALIEQQAYITAALGLSLEKLSKEELETTKDVLHSILQGVSCRLESPNHLVRRMASCVALVFSKVIDPTNPLYLDDECKEDPINWEFGLTVLQKKLAATSYSEEAKQLPAAPEKDFGRAKNTKDIVTKHKSDKELFDFQLVDPDEIIDPAMLNNESLSVDGDENYESQSESSSDSALEPYDLSDDDGDLKRKFSQLTDIVSALRKSDDPDGVESALDITEKLIKALPDELQHVAADLARALVHIRCSDLTVEGEEESAEEKRQKALVALLVSCPFESSNSLSKLLYSPHIDVSQRILILDVMTEAAQELAEMKNIEVHYQGSSLISSASGSQPWFLPMAEGPSGAGPWKEVSETGTVLSYTHRFERELPPSLGQNKRGKSRRWSLRPTKMQENKMEQSTNKFPLYGAAFMLPFMEGFDRKTHGVDLLGRDFIVLGKLIYMLGVCMKCMAMHPEASALAPALLDMLSSREIFNHAEAYVRKSALFAASCILISLHPSFVASALVEGNRAISSRLEWIRTWALHVTESDPDTELSTMAMSCLRLHAEMALQASRSFESGDLFKSAKSSSSVLRDAIVIPYPKTHL